MGGARAGVVRRGRRGHNRALQQKIHHINQDTPGGKTLFVKEQLCETTSTWRENALEDQADNAAPAAAAKEKHGGNNPT